MKKEDIKFTHLAIYRLKKNTGKDIMEYAEQFKTGNFGVMDIYDLLLATSKFETVEEMVEKLEGSIDELIEAIKVGLEILFKGKASLKPVVQDQEKNQK